MTNRDRVVAALEFRQTEKLPYNVDMTKPMYEKMLADPDGKAFLPKINNHVSSISLRRPYEEVPGRPGYYRDEFGVIWNRTIDKDIGVIENKLIPDPDSLKDFEFPVLDEKHLRSECERLTALANGNFTVASLGNSLFERAWSLCSMEDMLCYMVSNPDFVHELLDKMVAFDMRKVDIFLEYDIDCILFGDDWGQQKGLIMGPPHWREYILPCIKKLYGRARDAGRWIAQHSCGDLREILGEVTGAGLNLYQTFQPEIYGLAEYKPKIDKKLAIWGGISNQADLPFRTPAEMAEVVSETVSIMWKNGGYLAAPTHAVPRDVPVANIIAMVEAFENARG